MGLVRAVIANVHIAAIMHGAGNPRAFIEAVSVAVEIRWCCLLMRTKEGASMVPVGFFISC